MTEQHEGSKKQTKNGWKYLSFVLIGILAFGVTVTTLPRAVAAPPEGGTGEQMMLLLTQIQEAVLGIEDTVESQSNHVQRGLVEIDPDVGDRFWLLGETNADEATVYSGQITLQFLNGSDELVLGCQQFDIDTGIVAIGTAILATVDSSSKYAVTHFNCNALFIFEDDTDDTGSFVMYNMEYRVTDEAEEVDTNE